MDHAIRTYLRRARANLEELSRKARLETSATGREIVQDVLTEYASALMMLQLALRENLEMSAAMPSESGDVQFITIVNPAAVFDYVSCAVTALGYRPEDLTGKRVFDYVHPDEVERVYQSFDSGIRNPQVPIEISFRFRAADGDWIWLQVRAQNLSFGAQVDGFVSRCRIIPPVPDPI